MSLQSSSLRTYILLTFITLLILAFSLFALIQQASPVNAASSSSPLLPSSPRLLVSPLSFTNCWTCSATLKNQSSQQLIWTAMANVTGISFSQTNGTLSQKQSLIV